LPSAVPLHDFCPYTLSAIRVNFIAPHSLLEQSSLLRLF